MNVQGTVDALTELGYRLRMVSPADAPRVAVLDAAGIEVRVGPIEDRPRVVEFADALVRVDGGDWGDGRAGMQYRDLIPERHGGVVIASHIRIPTPGPVPDYVHHHDVEFQIIHVRRGSVEVVYEDQGEPFWMHAGDTVLQPPHIRHRVLASADGCEVVEVAAPAEHPTFVDHDLELPTDRVDPSRDFSGQRFSFDRGAELGWDAVDGGWEEQRTGIEAATGGVGGVRRLRARRGGAATGGRHDGLLCLFVGLDGEATLDVDGESLRLRSDDSIAAPAGSRWKLTADTSETTVLHVEVHHD